MIINYAHRGASFIYPENTMLAFEKALEMGCTGIETDIQRTKDGVLVLIHDEYVNRTTDGVGLVCDYTYKELKKLDAGKFKDKRYKNIKIPTLKEFLSYVKDKNIKINLEIKNSIIPYKGIEKEILFEILNTKVEDNIIVSSFNHNSMIELKTMYPKIKIAALCEYIVSDLEKYKIDKFEYIHPNYIFADKKEILKCHNKKMGVNLYTINDEKNMEKFIKYKIEGIITNCPDKLKEVIDKNKF